MPFIFLVWAGLGLRDRRIVSLLRPSPDERAGGP